MRRKRVLSREVIEETQKRIRDRKRRICEEEKKEKTLEKDSIEQEKIDKSRMEQMESSRMELDDLSDEVSFCEKHYDPENNIDHRWSVLSTQDLMRMFFLLSTTNSKSAVNHYFATDSIENEQTMRTLIFDDSKIIRVEICVSSGEDYERCTCEEISSKGELVFCDLYEKMRNLVSIFGAQFQNTQIDIVNGKSTSSPMASKVLKSKMVNEMEHGRMKVHFASGFDGISIKNTKASIRAVMVAAIYLGDVDPTAVVHDRITKWACFQLQQHVVWKDVKFVGEIVVGVHDDPARRKVYGLKGLSSKGSCPYCLNQGTMRKLFKGSEECEKKVHEGRNDVLILVRVNIIDPNEQGLEDGLKTPGSYTFFHFIAPMWDAPLDLFHTLNEGVFDPLSRLNNTKIYSEHARSAAKKRAHASENVSSSSAENRTGMEKEHEKENEKENEKK
uniref:DDE_Tnp_1_7 domain-containing protein n=2 Tax=Caenorhabditis tropicalis TaxID=1561998 RepID=A0A1I7V3D6_9PELO